MIIAIVFFVLVGCLAFVGSKIVQSEGILGNMHEGMMAGISLKVAGILYIIYACVCIAPTIYIMRASKAGKAAASGMDNRHLTEYEKNTKSFWKFCGIVTILFLVFTLLLICAAIMASMAIATIY